MLFDAIIMLFIETLLRVVHNYTLSNPTVHSKGCHMLYN